MSRFLKTNYRPSSDEVKISKEALENIAAVGSIVVVKGGTLVADPDAT